MEVGKQYFFKMKNGRGRPFVGKLVKKMGIFVEMENRGQMVRVQTKNVGREYSFKPYQTKGRIQASQNG